ncbi:AAA family ATPase [bacterium]|nr:AAA family ATPase [bacterium]
MPNRSWVGMRVLSIANLKGGVGKSTTSMMIADTLALHFGMRVLLVDLDPQANLSQMMLSPAGLKKADDAGRTLRHWVNAVNHVEAQSLATYVKRGACNLHEVKRLRDAHLAKDHGDIDLVPATPELRFAELDFDHKNHNPEETTAAMKRMRDLISAALEELRSAYDLVIFDCPPGFSTLMQAALCLSDAILSPIQEAELSVWSLKAFRDFGLHRTLGLSDDARHRVVFTRVRRQGAASERRKIRTDTERFGFKPLSTSAEVLESSQSHRWVRRKAVDSYERFGNKYGPARASVQSLGKEVLEFIETAHQNPEAR